MELKVPYPIINKYKIELLILFGSAGTEYENSKSDLDIGFLTEDLISKDVEYDLLKEITSFYNRGDIDLVNLRKANPTFKLEVSREGKIIFEKNNSFERFQLYAARIFADTKPLREARAQTLKERITQHGWSKGLRNRLVHEYEEIDDEIVYKKKKKTYKYYNNYMKFIINYIEK